MFRKEDDDAYTVRESIEMMNLNHIFQTKQNERQTTIGFNTDSLYQNLEEQIKKEKLF
ncbi:MAG: hypothetical protein ACLU84_05290 [Clostridia bacterium]